MVIKHPIYTFSGIFLRMDILRKYISAIILKSALPKSRHPAILSRCFFKTIFIIQGVIYWASFLNAHMRPVVVISELIWATSSFQEFLNSNTNWRQLLVAVYKIWMPRRQSFEVIIWISVPNVLYLICLVFGFSKIRNNFIIFICFF